MSKDAALARSAIAVVAVTCALHVHCAPAGERDTSSFAEAERSMSQARPPRTDEHGGHVLDTHRQVLSARVSGTGLDLTTRGSKARVERLGASVRDARLWGNVVRSSGDAERFVFSRGEEIEELDLLDRPTELAYRLVLPEGFRLRALSPALVQVDDASGDPWLRMRADRAWSEDGHEVAVSLDVDGDVVRVVVPSDATYPLLVDPVWASASSMVHPRESHAATLLGDGRVLVTGAFDFATSDTAEIYDPRTGLFTALEPVKMKAKRSRHRAIMLRSGKVLLVGGTPIAPAAEVFDPTTSTFTAVPNGSAIAGGITLAAPLLDGRVLVKGNADNVAASPPAAEVFDPQTSAFTPTNPGALEARGTMVTLPDGRVLLFGECEIESWDPQSTTWTKLAGQFCSQPEARGVAVMRDGRVLVTGGGLTCNGTSLCGDVRAYDPATESYDAVTPLIEPDGRGASATLLPSGKVLVSGSYDSTTKARIYDPSDNSFVEEAPTASAHRRQTATMLPGGDVLVLGGEQNTADVRAWTGAIAPTNGNMVAARYAAAVERLEDGTVLIAGGSFHPPAATGSTLASAELYDPEGRTFSATSGALTTPRENAIVAPLPSGKVLIAGGNEVGTDAAKASAEVYDPQTKQFASVGSMTAARTRHAAARLPGGKVLVTGGCSDASACLVGNDADASRLKTAEIFDPATSTFTATAPMISERSEHGLVTMPDGRVLVVGTEGQKALNVEVYDPKTGLFDIVPSLFMPSMQHGRSALLLSNGRVFVGGGGGASGGPNLIADAVAANPTWTSSAGIGFGLMAAQYMPTLGGEQLLLVGGVKPKGNGLADGDTAESRVAVLELLVAQNAATVVTDLGAGAGRRDVATSNVDRGILVAGGDSGFGGSAGSVTDTAYVHSDGANDAWRPVLTVAPAKIKAGATATLEGERFTSTLGDTPIALWQPAGSKTFVPTRITAFSATTATWTAPVTALYGGGFLHVVTDGVASNSRYVEIEPAEGGTACTYDAQCGSGFCTEGVCCDARCDGSCQSCTQRRKGSGADGVCGAVVAGADPDARCVSENGVTCSSAAACKSGFCVGGVCCNDSCLGSCRTCATGVCRETATCGDALPPVQKCISDSLLDVPDDRDVDCTPYRCNVDACRTECSSANDCVDPYVCSYEGRCILAPFVKPANESLFGCAASRRPHGSLAALGILFALAAARVARTRTRTRGAPT